MSLQRESNARRRFVQIESRYKLSGWLSEEQMAAQRNAERILRDEAGYTDSMISSLRRSAPPQ